MDLTNLFGGALDTSAVDTDSLGGFEPLPLGVQFQFEVSNVELRETKSGGTMLVVESTVLAPLHAGRKVWTNLNIVNASPGAEKRARAELQMLAGSCGVAELSDGDQLMGCIFACELRTEGSKDDRYPDKQVLDLSTASSTVTTQAPPKTPAAKTVAPKATPAAPAAKAPPPWAAKKQAA